MKYTMTAIFVCSALTMIPVTAQERGPSGCPPGVSEREYICLTLKEAARTDETLIRLKRDLDLARARRFHFTVRPVCPALGVAGVVDENFDARAIPAAFCGVGLVW